MHTSAAMRPVETEQGEPPRRLMSNQRRPQELLERQASLLDLARDAILVRDVATDAVVYWSRGAEALYGWPRDAVVGKPARVVLRTHFPGPPQEIDAAVRRDGTWQGELVHTRRDGCQVTVASRWALQPDDDGRAVAILEVGTDITARKAMEASLRECDARFARAQRITHLGDFRWDFATNLVYWSNEMFRLLGYAPGEVTPSLAAFVDAVHPQDRPVIASFMAGAYQGRADPFQFRIAGRDGTARILLAQTEVVCDATGKAQRIFGTGLDVTDQQRAEVALAEQQRRLEDLVRRLLLAQEEERRRVAYDIHDGLAQLAVGTQQRIETLARYYRPRRPDTRDKLDRARALAQRTVLEARRVIAGLRPTALDDFGLATALRLDIEARRADGWVIAYDETLGPERLPPTIETALFRIVQEALTNVGKHAGATRVQVALRRRRATVHLMVRDWGKGFDPRAVDRRGLGQQVGLAGMRERVGLVGGRWQVRSWPGQGTRVVAEVPVPTAGV